MRSVTIAQRKTASGTGAIGIGGDWTQIPITEIISDLNSMFRIVSGNLVANKKCAVVVRGWCVFGNTDNGSRNYVRIRINKNGDDSETPQGVQSKILLNTFGTLTLETVMELEADDSIVFQATSGVEADIGVIAATDGDEINAQLTVSVLG